MFTHEPLPATSPAGVLKSTRRLQVEEIPIWPIASYGDDDLVLIKVAACGVCGSDFRYFQGENPWAQHTLGEERGNPPNIVLGHEYAGTVVAVLSETNRRLLGKRVAPICSKVCGWCEECRAGRSRMCPNTIHLGHGQGWGQKPYYPGACCRYVPSWGASCYEISDSLGFDEAAMMDILAVCVHVAEVGGVQPARPVLCIGAGPAGNGLAQTALIMGADRTVLLDRAPTALDIARKQNLGTVIDVSGLSGSDLLNAVQKAAPEGYGTVFDSVGTPQTLEMGLKALGKGGGYVSLAVHAGQPIPFDIMSLGAERRMVTSCNFEIGDYAKALAWLEAGRYRVKEWFTPITLAEVPGRFEKIVANPDEKGVFKMVVDPWK